MKWVKTMPKAKKEGTLDLETPIEEVVETPAEEVVESKAKDEKSEDKKPEAKEPKAKPEVKTQVVTPILNTELFAVQHKRTAD